jgi:hypothetical protein
VNGLDEHDFKHEPIDGEAKIILEEETHGTELPKIEQPKTSLWSGLWEWGVFFIFGTFFLIWVIGFTWNDIVQKEYQVRTQAAYNQPASPSITASNPQNASIEPELTPSNRFMNELRAQDAQKIVAYLQNHKYLEATWTAASGETRGAIAGTREEISDGFAVLTKIETSTEDGRSGDSYDVWMVDENSDGVLDAIMYINSRNPEEKHAYHHPTDEASMLYWNLSLRELAKAAR